MLKGTELNIYFVINCDYVQVAKEYNYVNKA